MRGHGCKAEGNIAVSSFFLFLQWTLWETITNYLHTTVRAALKNQCYGLPSDFALVIKNIICKTTNGGCG